MDQQTQTDFGFDLTRGEQLFLIDQFAERLPDNGEVPEGKKTVRVSASVIAAVVRCIDAHARANSVCTASQETLSKKTRTSIRNVTRAIKWLDMNGYIVTRRRSKSSETKIVFNALMESYCDEPAPVLAVSAPPQNCSAPPSVQSAPPQWRTNRIETVNQPPPADAPPREGGGGDSFSILTAAGMYPRNARELIDGFELTPDLCRWLVETYESNACLTSIGSIGVYVRNVAEGVPPEKAWPSREPVVPAKTADQKQAESDAARSSRTAELARARIEREQKLRSDEREQVFGPILDSMPAESRVELAEQFLTESQLRQFRAGRVMIIRDDLLDALAQRELV